MSDHGRLPRWLKPLNRVVVALQRLGLTIGTMRLLSVPGRKSGKLRTTPVSPLTVDGRRYIVAGLDGADWVKNARVAGWGILARGRQAERVTLTELAPEERGPILRAFPRLVPHGVQFFQQVHGVTNDPEAFAALAPRCPVFRVDRVSETGRRSRVPEGRSGLA
jgi:deazaflavin-dependent oxidoreductase (nitroreductase family)